MRVCVRACVRPQMNVARRGEGSTSPSASGFRSSPHGAPLFRVGRRAARGPRQPRRQGAPARSRRERAPRGPETRRAPAWSRGPARWAGVVGSWGARAGGCGRRGPRGAAWGDVGGPGGADAGPRAAAPRRPPLDAACCPGRLRCGTRAKSRRARNEAPRRAVTPARPGPLERTRWGSQELPHRTGEGPRLREIRQGAHRVRKSQCPHGGTGALTLPGPGTLGPASEITGEAVTGAPPYLPLPARSPAPEGLPGPGESSCCPGPPRAWLPSIPPEPRVGTGLAASTPPNTFPPTPEPVLISSSVPLPVALPPQMAWEVAPSRMTALAPWDPNYKAKAGPRLVWVSWEYLPPWPGDGAGVPREGTEAPVIFLALSTGAQLCVRCLLLRPDLVSSLLLAAV